MIDDLAYSLKRVLHGPRQKAPQTMAGDFKYSCYISYFLAGLFSGREWEEIFCMCGQCSLWMGIIKVQLVPPVIFSLLSIIFYLISLTCITPVDCSAPTFSYLLWLHDVLNKWTVALVSFWIHEESISVPECWHPECQFMSTRTWSRASSVCLSGSRTRTQYLSSVSLRLHCQVRKIEKL